MEEEKNIEELENELTELKGKYLRLLADFDNFKKNKIKEIENLRKYCNEQLLADLLDIFDIVDYSNNPKFDKDKVSIEEKYKFLVERLKNSLELYGIKEILTDKFDDNFHNAVMVSHDDTKENGEILEVWKKGYMYKDKVLRYANVTVNKL